MEKPNKGHLIYKYMYIYNIRTLSCIIGKYKIYVYDKPAPVRRTRYNIIDKVCQGPATARYSGFLPQRYN